MSADLFVVRVTIGFSMPSGCSMYEACVKHTRTRITNSLCEPDPPHNKELAMETELPWARARRAAFCTCAMQSARACRADR